MPCWRSWGLAGWQRSGGPEDYRPVQSAYEDAVQRHQGGENLRRALAPQQAGPVADAGDGVGVDNARLAEGASASGVDNARLAEGANASGVEPRYRLAEGANASGVDNARIN